MGSGGGTSIESVATRVALGRRVWFGIATALITLGVVEVASFASFSLLARVKDVRWQPLRAAVRPEQRRIYERFLDGRSYLAPSRLLGWTLRPGGRTPLYRVNEQGLRGDVEYARRPAPGVVRVATVGDSYTFCSQVANEHTWQAQLERLEPEFELLNFGIPAQGVDQAFLRYREEVPGFHPEMVLIGFFTENVHRHVNRYRPFYVSATDVPFGKPRFRLAGGRLVLVPNPFPDAASYRRLVAEPARSIRRAGEHDYYYETRYHEGPLDGSRTVRALRLLHHELRQSLLGRAPVADDVYNVRSEAFQVTAALFDEFVARVRGDGAVPIVVIHPSRADVARYLAAGSRIDAPLLSHLRARGHELIDLLPPLARAAESVALDRLFISHYSPRANAIVARHVAARLRERHDAPRGGPAR